MNQMHQIQNIGMLCLLGLIVSAATLCVVDYETVASELKKTHGIVALFSPIDNVAQALCDIIDQEKKQIVIMMYAFTNKLIADALLRAHKRKVTVILLVDRACVNDRYNKVEYLASQNIMVYVYDPVFEHAKETHGIMHNKCALFSKNIHNKSIVVTGSFNYTQLASSKNHENVVIFAHDRLFNEYTIYFEQLKKKSISLNHWREQRPVVYNNMYQRCTDLYEDFITTIPS